MLKTKLTELTGIDHPIIQAGMGADAGPALAAAVSNAGALGTLGTIGAPVSLIRENIAATRAATSRPFAVNIITFDWAPFAPQLLDLVIEERVPVVTLSFGSFESALSRCKAAGIVTIVQVQDVEGAMAGVAARLGALDDDGVRPLFERRYRALDILHLHDRHDVRRLASRQSGFERPEREGNHGHTLFDH